MTAQLDWGTGENEAGYGRKGADYNSSLERDIKGGLMLFVSENMWQG